MFKYLLRSVSIFGMADKKTRSIFHRHVVLVFLVQSKWIERFSLFVHWPTVATKLTARMRAFLVFISGFCYHFFSFHHLQSCKSIVFLLFCFKLQYARGNVNVGRFKSYPAVIPIHRFYRIGINQFKYK